MGVAGEAPTAITGRFVVELKAQSEEEGQDELDKRLGIVEELEVGGFIVEIDGDRAVLCVSVCRSGPCLISMQMAVGADETW